MKNKTLSLMTLTILSLVMLVSFASAAALELDLVSAPTTVEAGSTVTVTFNLSAPDATVDYDVLVWTGSSSNVGTWTTLPTITSIDIGQTIPNLVAVLTVPESASGTITAVIDLQSETSADAQLSVPTITITQPDRPDEITECILVGDNGNLELTLEDIKVDKGFGDDEEWFPLDTIEFEVEVENKGDEKIKDIAVSWGLYDEDNDDWIIDDEESDFNLKDGDDDTLIITFELDDPSDYEDTSNYVFYVWAEGEDTELDENTCVSTSEDIEVINDEAFLIMADFEYLDTASCGDSVPVSAEIWNVGDEDHEEVSVVIYNNELGYSQIVEVGDVDGYDNVAFNVVLEMPSDATEKTYPFKFEIRDEDNDVFENDFDDDESIFTVNLKVEGCAVAQTASVSASLESGGKAGKPLVIKSTVINTADEAVTYTVNAASYTEWADSASVDQGTFTLPAGNSKDVLITFDVTKDASGTKFFDLEVVSENELVTTQPVSVQIEGSSSNYIWLLGVLIAVLVVAIIIVAMRLARR
ncbi:putative S-layer protein [Candidatus Pacearchaeota archaeon]|nr:putative S-layer protein [Candidatus Pacearchaeota archaeon]